VANGHHVSSNSLKSNYSSSSSIETAIVTRTLQTESHAVVTKKDKRNSAHLGSDKYLKSCAMDFQYVEVTDSRNGDTHHATVNHGHIVDVPTHLLALSEEENVSITSSSDESSTIQPLSLAVALENVLAALEEPRGLVCSHCVLYSIICGVWIVVTMPCVQFFCLVYTISVST